MTDPSRRGAQAIGAVSVQFGISCRALRFYEKEGLLTPERAGSQRWYYEKDVTRIRLILLAKKFGFTIGEIRKLIDSRILANTELREAGDLGLSQTELVSRIDMLVQQREELDMAIAELREAVRQRAIQDLDFSRE